MEISKEVTPHHEGIKVTLVIGVSLLCGIAMFGVPSFPAATDSSPLMSGGIALIGFAIGCYGTLVGIGGGPLIMPVLIMFYGWENEFLVATSLLIVFLNTLSGSIGYARQKRIDYKGGLKFSAAAIPGAILMGYVHHLINIRTFDVIFGVFLILLAVYTLLSAGRIGETADEIRRAKEGGSRHEHFTDGFGKEFEYYSNDSLGICLNALLGFFVGFLGIGGGILQVPILVFLLSYPVHIATATSHFITATVSLFALIPHIYLGNIYFQEVAWMGAGVLLGAQAGARLAPKVNAKIIVYLFAVVIVFLAFKMVMQ